MRSLDNYLKDDKNHFFDYNIELLAGMYLQPKDKFYPTILLFRTGSYTLMGGKSFKCNHKSEHFVKDLIKKFER